MAVGRSGSAGSQHNRAVPDRAVPGGIGGSVLPAGEKAGGAGGNRSQGSLHRRYKDGEPSGAVQLCKDYSRLAFFFNSGFHYVEVFAGLFPYLQARRRAVTIVIVARCTPEIRLDTETVLEILNTVYLVRGNDARFFVENKRYFR